MEVVAGGLYRYYSDSVTVFKVYYADEDADIVLFRPENYLYKTWRTVHYSKFVKNYRRIEAPIMTDVIDGGHVVLTDSKEQKEVAVIESPRVDPNAKVPVKQEKSKEWAVLRERMQSLSKEVMGGSQKAE